MQDLKQRAIRGGAAKLCAQGLNFALRIGSLMVMARLLDPRDFGLVGMVAAFTGVLNLFRDFGLSAATVQRVDVTEEQISTLFWLNVVVGLVLWMSLAALGPFLADFYREPRLQSLTVFLATAFIFNAAGVQHSALLQRQMRFAEIAKIDTIALAASTTTGIIMAKSGFGYWALVVAAVSLPFVTTIGLWLTTGWIPGRPRRRVGLHSMMKFGGSLTLVSIIVYIAYNLEKVLLGRFWGAEVVGIYGRAYQLINIPTDNLNSGVGEVAFSALSRVQNDPDRLRNYFLKGYSLVLALTIPITIAVAVFARDLVAVLLGPKWSSAAEIFQLLAPTILIFALINPIGWLIFSLGMVGRSLKVALILAPLVISGYVIGLPYGPKGVAIGYSTVMTLWVVPHIAWGIHGTAVSLSDIFRTLSRPLTSGLVAGGLALAVHLALGQRFSPILRLVLEGLVLLSAYAGTLLYVMGQKGFYLDLVSGLRRRSAIEQPQLVTVQ